MVSGIVQNQLIAFGSTDEGQRDSSVSRSRLDHDAVSVELTIALGGLDHGLTNTILHASERVEEFTLQIDVSGETFSSVVNFYKWGIAHGVGNRIEFFAHNV